MYSNVDLCSYVFLGHLADDELFLHFYLVIIQIMQIVYHCEMFLKSSWTFQQSLSNELSMKDQVCCTMAPWTT